MSNYYCLVAELPEIAFDGSTPAFTVARFREEVYPLLSAADARCVNLIFLAQDNANILEILRKGENADIQQTGCYTYAELLEFIETAKNGDKRAKSVPEYIYDFVEYYVQNETATSILWEDVLNTYYYNYAQKCSNKFVAEWFLFNLNVNNVLAAMAARKYGMNVPGVVIGDNEVAECLRTSGARDFGLSGTFEQLEVLQRMCENGKLQERERQLDELRWKWLDENSVFNYFTVERLFVFLVKLSIVERWQALDEEKGMERYREMISALKSGMDAQSISLK